MHAASGIALHVDRTKPYHLLKLYRYTCALRKIAPALKLLNLLRHHSGLLQGARRILRLML
jgi:hypothetical protein